MDNFYFTYGTDESYPFKGGWTKVRAKTREEAAALFMKVHPHPELNNTLNCCGIYSEEEFQNTNMPEQGNNGHKEWEVLKIERNTRSRKSSE